MMRRKLCAAMALLTAGILGFAIVAAAADDAPAYQLPKDAPAYIRAAIADPARTPEQRARDTNRKPAELLMMSGVKPGHTVVELGSFGQYFTTFLVDIVGPKGKVYMFDEPYLEKRYGEPSRAFAAAHPNAQYQAIDYNSLELPQHVDEVVIVLYYHDLFINHVDTAALDARIFKALKPGGTFFIVDHNATPGSGITDTPKLHRIDPAVIEKEVTAAGFKLAKKSDLLARPGDDHTQMVFAPALRGQTDQTIFVFRKPKG